MPASQGYVTPDPGVRLYFERLGEGGDAVIIPNGFHMLHDFRPLARGRTLIFYDVRNRGWSEAVNDPQKLARGIHNDVDDLDAVRRHFGFDQVALVGHSYIGMMVLLYAMKHPERVNRIVQIGPMPPNAATKYPAHLAYADSTLGEVFSKLGELQKERDSCDPVEFCKKFWSVLQMIYVVNPADANKLDWGRCELPNERNFMKYWNEHINPSIQSLNLTAQEFMKVQAPVLTVHAFKDRSAPYGGGRDWAAMLPDARLLTVENAAHAPWIESPELVLGAMETFLGGRWPEAAERITSTADPEDRS